MSEKPRLRCVNNGKQTKRVKEDQLDSYLESGWSIGSLPSTKNYMWVHKDGKNTTIDKSKLDEYLANGYEIGKISSRKENNCVRVNKDGITKSIQKEELDKYLSDGWTRGVSYASNFRWINNLKEEKWTDEPLLDGWYLGRLVKNPHKLVSMYKGTEVIKIEKYLVGTYKEKGYQVGIGRKNGLYEGSTKNTTWMNNGEETILVKNDKVDEYLAKGYVKGNLYLRNIIYIHDDSKTIRVKLSELTDYLDNGYVLGSTIPNHMIGKKWIQKDDLYKAVPIEELQSYLDDGWTYGRPIKAALNRIVVHKDDEAIYIDPEDFPKYLSMGWHSGRLDNNNEFYITNEKEDKLVTFDEYNLHYRNSNEWRIGTKNHGPTSTVESEFIKLLENNDISYESHFYLNYNGKKYFYDFKVGDILIELNPFATHNSTWSPYNNPVAEDYHYLKSKAAVESGYRCICMWDWDSVDILLSLLKPRKTIYAKQCELKEVSVKDAKEFLNSNHFQGYARDTIRLGLYYEDELVSIMTFDKPRYAKKYDYEIVRYCSTCNITGGAEKLFSNFVKTYSPTSIISYCDMSKFNGTTYSKLGFKYDGYSIGKHWYNDAHKKHITDNLLRQQGFDRLVGDIFGTYGKGSNNVELMLEHKFVEIYDCGQSRYVWESSN